MVVSNKELFQKLEKLARENNRVRVVLVYNPRSSKAKKVEEEVINPFRSQIEKGSFPLTLAKYEVKPTNVDDNALQLSKLLVDGDVVLTAGGDGTAAIGLNGAMLSEKNIYFYALPFGNFNDMPRALRKATDPERKIYPLEALVNGKHYRYAACYFTIGMFAESTEIFDKPAQRKHLQKGKKSLIYSVRQLAGWYFKNKKRDFIPNFKLERKIVAWKRDGQFLSSPKVVEAETKDISDYMAVNGVSVAKVMRGGEWYTTRSEFLSTTRVLTKFFKLVGFMLKSILFGIPGRLSVNDKLIFDKPAEIEIQAEGEYCRLTNVSEIEIRKTGKYLNIL